MSVLNSLKSVHKLLIFKRNLVFYLLRPLSDNIEPVHLSFAIFQAHPDSEITSPPLICVHELLSSKSHFEKVCGRLAKVLKPPRKIITVDARNHGESPHSPVHSYEAISVDLHLLMKNLKIDKASLLGHSAGGRACMMFSFKWPEMVENLIVAESCPYGPCPNIKPAFRTLKFLSDHYIIKDLSIKHAWTSIEPALAQVVLDPKNREALLKNLIKIDVDKISWKMNVKVLMEHFDKMTIFPEIPKDIQFTGRVLFITGANTSTIPNNERKLVLRMFPNAYFIVIPNGGHDLHTEHYEEFMEIVIEFLRNQPAFDKFVYTLISQ